MQIICLEAAQNLQACPLGRNLPLSDQNITYQKEPGMHLTAPPTPPTEIHVQYQTPKLTPTQEDSFNWLQTNSIKNNIPSPLSSHCKKPSNGISPTEGFLF